jgi:hypothetical protein
MKSEMMQEIMGEAIDGAMDNDEEEEDRVVAQVLDEIGIAMSEGIPNAPEVGLGAANVSTGSLKADGGKVALAAGENDGDDTNVGGRGGGATDTAISDLEARLNNLKR